MHKMHFEILMNKITESTIKYENPPIDEIICGIRLDSIKKLKAGHFGVLWQKFKPDFSQIEDQIPANPIPAEDFENLDKLPLPRVWFIHRDENELIQVQRNCFLHNWRKRRSDDAYPGYEKVVENFEIYLSRFQEFLKEESLGHLVPKQYELIYIDLIPKGQGWESPGDLEKVFPNLLSLTKQGIFLNNIKGINWQIILELPNGLGEVAISIRNAQRISNKQELINMEFKAVSSQAYQPMRGWFDDAHNTIMNLFCNLISYEIQEKFWVRKL